jgi:CRISPR/Cas system CMR-associated protein Cmr3 (group 5 of RAMP superfamily)
MLAIYVKNKNAKKNHLLRGNEKNMVYTFFFRKELTQNKVNTHFHDLNRIVCRLLTEKTHVQPCFIQM